MRLKFDLIGFNLRSIDGISRIYGTRLRTRKHFWHQNDGNDDEHCRPGQAFLKLAFHGWQVYRDEAIKTVANPRLAPPS